MYLPMIMVLRALQLTDFNIQKEITETFISVIAKLKIIRVIQPTSTTIVAMVL